MTLTGNPLQIVVAYDFSDLADLALEQAIGLANRETPAVIHVLGVYGGKYGAAMTHAPHKKYDYKAVEQEQRRMEAVVSRYASGVADGVRFFVHARIGKPAEETLELAAEVGAGAIFIGTHGRKGLERIALGSVAEKVMRDACCAVTVVRPNTYRRPNAIANVPEPPCPHCVARREETGGAQWWCEPHQRPWIAPKRYAPTRGKLVPVRDDAWILW